MTKTEMEARIVELEAALAEANEPRVASAVECLNVAESWLRECFTAAKHENKHALLDEQYALGALARIRSAL